MTKTRIITRNRIIIALAVMLSACQVTPEIAELQSENTTLQTQLTGAQQQIKDLKAQEKELQTQNQELKRVSNVLTMEKTSRVEESSTLRLQVRKFVQQQIDDLKAFLVKGNLLDYIGSELVKRSHVDNKAMGLVDFAHPMPHSGSLTGVAGFFSAPADLRLKVLRPINDKYVVIWQSEILSVVKAGENRIQLPVSVGVEPGDLIAYVFPEAVNVSFDKGTGDTRYTDRDLALGDALSASSFDGEDEKRAYSLGILAILE